MTHEQEQAQKLVEIASRPEWAHTLPAQLLTLQQLSVLKPALEPEIWLSIRKRIAAYLRIHPIRLDYLLAMRNERDLRIGLAWKNEKVRLDPTELVYKQAGGWLERYCAYALPGETHVGFHFWCGIAVLSAACRRNFYLEMGGHEGVFPNQYILLEGPSGCGKNTAIETAQKVLEGMNARLEEQNLQKPKWSLPTVHLFPRRVHPDLFLEILQQQARRLPTTDTSALQTYEQCGLLVVEELTTLLGKGLRGSDTMIHLLTALYDGHFDEATTKSGYVPMDHVAISCLFASTLEWLRKDMTENIFKGGFLGARCLMISKHKSNRVYPPPVPHRDPVQREALSEQLCEYAKADPHPMDFSADARKIMADWYGKPIVKQGVTDPRLHAYLERRDIHLTKLALAISLSRGELQEVSGSSLEAAIHILEHEEPSMMDNFLQIGGRYYESDLDYIVRRLTQAGGAMRHKDLRTRVRGRITKKDRFAELIGALIMQGRLGRTMIPSPERGGASGVTYWIPGSEQDPALIRAAEMQNEEIEAEPLQPAERPHRVEH